jgi:flagellin
MINPFRPSPSATSAIRQGNDARSELQKTTERLSSGLRINKAADDAAGIAIAAQMTAELNGLFQASRNARDAMSLVQTAEGGLTEVGGMMDRMRTLAIQSASDVLGPQERASIQKEVNQLQNEIGRTVDTTAFNGRKLLDGSLQNARFQVGPDAGQEIALSVSGIQTPNVDLTSFNGASAAITSLDSSLRSVNDQRATLGATVNRLSSTIDNIDTSVDSVLASRSRIQDADVARESAERARQEVLARGTIAILAQANVMPGIANRLLGA